MSSTYPDFSEDEVLRPSVVDIDLDRLAANYRLIQEHVGQVQIMPILKANAYGHGLIPCAKTLEAAGASSLGVAFLEEGIRLRREGIHIPILALGGISGRQIDLYLKYNIDLTASSVYKLERVDAAAKKMGVKARVQLKIDTGMERIGMHYYSAKELVEEALRCKNCEIVGVFSHLATSEQEDHSFARVQLERFLEVVDVFEKHSVEIPTRHLANSGAVLQLPETHLDMVRPGLLLFGVMPGPRFSGALPLSPVLSLKSEVVFFKVVRKGAGVSYDLTWTAPEDTRVITIPLGYGDGYSRRLSNCGEALIRGHRFPLVGNVCMDQLMVNIGTEGIGYNGDEVVLIGEQGEERITVEDISEKVDTDPRDVLCSMNTRLPRRFHAKDKVFVE